MKLYPAIDLRGGQAVRLYQGDYDQMTVYNPDPVAQAKDFAAAGAKYLHVVDLDGAKDGQAVNFATIQSITAAGDLFVEVGGGIRDQQRIEDYLALGVGRCILGTIAVRDFDFTARMARTYGDRIVVGVDMKDGYVAVSGWKEVTPEPGLDFSRLPEMVRFIEEASGIRLSPRAPYTGELVFTAFSGTHQDAIRKGMARREEIAEFFGQGWKMPYLHIDPADLGRSYDGLIRINSQSGKGGVAYVLEYVYGIRLPKEMQPMVAFAVQREAETTGRELTPAEVYRIFREKILEPAEAAIRLEGFRIQRPVPGEPDKTGVELELKSRGVLYAVSGVGGGPIEAATAALHKCGAIPEFQLEEYSEHALGRGATAQAAAYVGIRDDSGRMIYGAGIDRNINLAAIRAIVNAINHTLEE